MSRARLAVAINCDGSDNKLVNQVVLREAKRKKLLNSFDYPVFVIAF